MKTSSPNSTGRITDRWTEPTLIEVKPVASSLAANRPNTSARPAGTAGMVGRRALPGLPNPAAVAVVDKDEKSMKKDKEERTTVPPSTTRHTRIPSTGNRALVMEVAQALSEAAQHQGKEREEKEEKMAVSTPVPVPIPARQVPSTALVGQATEKRKSSYERYSAIAMPPLAEERTPAATPAHTFSRSVGQDLVLGGKAIGESPSSSLHLESAGAAAQSPSAPPSLSSKVHIGEDRVL